MAVHIRDIRRNPPLRKWLEQAYAAWLREIGARDFEPAAARAELEAALMVHGTEALVIERDHVPAGFALIRAESGTSRPKWRLLEFFVVVERRGLGVGGAAARLLFDRFAGDWEIVSLVQETAALAFWRHVLAGYAPGRVNEIRGVGETLQRFTSRGSR